MADLSTSRNQAVDIVKGLAIVLVVLGHALARNPNSAYYFIYLFHVAAFFVASGYLFRGERVATKEMLGRFVLRRFVRLWVPGFCMLAGFLFLRLALMRIADSSVRLDPCRVVEGFASAVWLRPLEAAVVPVWFLQTLLAVSALYAGMEFALRHSRLASAGVQGALAVVLLAASRLFDGEIVWTAECGRLLTGYALFHLGVALRAVQPKLVRGARRYAWVAVIVLLGLFALFRCERIDLYLNSCRHAATLLAASLSGWLALYAAGVHLGRFGIGEAVAGLGRRALPVMLLHLPVFKALSFLLLLCRGWPPGVRDGVLVADIGPMTVGVYAAVGLSVPLVADALVRRGFRALRRMCGVRA